MELRAGTMVTPSVCLREPLGRGGMGAVWLADHLGLHTQVAVKFLGEALSESPEAIARFTREAASAAAVKSPHVVQMFDHGVMSDGTPFIVMELLEGEDLRMRLERKGRMTPAEVTLLVTQAASALSRAHERGVVHRDIKPDNIFLTDAGVGDFFVKVLDFGIAKLGATNQMGATKTGMMLGTPYYMSPEQTLGLKSVDHRTDLWSLGIVAYQALTGRRAFDAETIGALSIAICHGPLPLPTMVDPTLPRGLDAWFAKACAREPEARYGTARELADGLVQALQAPAVAPPYAPPSWAPPQQVPRPSAAESQGPGATVMMSTTSASSMAASGVAAPAQRRSRLPLVLGAASIAILGIVGGVVAFGMSSKAPPPSAAAPSPEEEGPGPAKKKAPKEAKPSEPTPEPVETAPPVVGKPPVAAAPLPAPKPDKPAASVGKPVAPEKPAPEKSLETPPEKPVAPPKPPEKPPVKPAEKPNDPNIF